MSAESNFRGQASYYIMINGYKDILEYWVICIIWIVPPNCSQLDQEYALRMYILLSR